MVDKKTNNTIESTNSFDSKEVVAKLKNCPTSPRKMRLVADQIRGLNVDKALVLLKHSTKEASIRLEKLINPSFNETIKSQMCKEIFDEEINNLVDSFIQKSSSKNKVLI